MRAIVTARAEIVEFPWNNGVLVTLMGEPELQNIINELGEIKKMINADANRHGLPLSAIEIKVEFL